MSDPSRVAVIGGGVSGLAAAHRLLELDPSTELTLFESSDRVGGVIRTEHVEGFCLEQGPDSLLTQVPWGLDLCRRIGLADDLISTNEERQGVYVVSRGRLRRLPQGLALMAPERLWPLATTAILSLPGKLRLAYEYFIPPRHDLGDESLAAFATRRLGQEAFDRLVQPLVTGIYMGLPDALSVRATFPRFVEMEQKYGGLIRGAKAQRRASGTRGAHKAASPAAGPRYQMFVAPRKGMQQLVQALAGRLPAGALRLATAVESVVRGPDQSWRVVNRQAGDEPRAETFDAVVIAAPAPVAARWLHGASESLAAEMAPIEYASCVVVNLAIRRDQLRHPLDAFGYVSPLIERRLVTACTFSSVKYSGRAPDGYCLMRAYLGGAANPHVVEWNDAELKKAVSDDLAPLLGMRSAPRFLTIRRYRRAMPQYEVGHLARIEQIERLVERMPGLSLAGNAYHGAGVAHCIQSGELAAEKVAGHLRQLAAIHTVGS